MPAPSPAAAEATAGFYGAGTGVRLFRLALAAAQGVWPALAVRAAQRVFTTPLPPKWLQRGPGWGVHWSIEHWPFEQATLTLYTPAVAPHRPLALLVHGWGGHARQLLPLAAALQEHGWTPVLLELPAHGRSAGTASNLPQFARAIEYVVARLRAQGHAVGLLAAHSLGASAAAQAASRGALVDRLVLLAPVASPRSYTHYFARVFGLREATRAAMQRRIEQREGVLMQQFEADAMGPRIRQPTLVVHDRGDRVNAFADGQAFAHAIGPAQLLATEDLGHRRILKDARVIGHVVVFAGRPG